MSLAMPSANSAAAKKQSTTSGNKTMAMVALTSIGDNSLRACIPLEDASATERVTLASVVTPKAVETRCRLFPTQPCEVLRRVS